MHEDEVVYVRACVVCCAHELVLHATLYHTMGVPKYAQHIYDYLTTSTISDQLNTKKRLIILESQRYRIISSQIYRIGLDGNLRLCVPEDKYLEVLFHAHSGARSGHFSANVTSKFVLYSRLWWPTLIMDSQEYIKRCDECQQGKVPTCYDNMPL